MFSQYLRSHSSHQRGAVFVLFAILFVPILLIGAALAINVSTVQVQKARLQNAADAAALAGASQLTIDVTTDTKSTITTSYIEPYITRNVSVIDNTGKAIPIKIGIVNSYINNSMGNTWNDEIKDYPLYGDTQTVNIVAHYYNNSSTSRTVRVDLRRRVPLYLFGFGEDGVISKILPNLTNITISARATANYNQSGVTAGIPFFAENTSSTAFMIESPNITFSGGNVGTNGKISLSTTPDTVTNGNVIGSKTNQPIWSNQNNTLSGNYSIKYEIPIDLNYQTNTGNNENVTAVATYINNVIKKSSTSYKGTNWWDDANEYPSLNLNGTGNIRYVSQTNQYTIPVVTSSSGPQIYYTSNSLNLQMGNTNYGTPKSMLLNGQYPTPYRYNVVIAKGDINASNFVTNDAANPLIIVSLQGGIQFHNDTPFYGILYAPNGTIKLDHAGSFYGSIIGNMLDFTETGQSLYYYNFSTIDDGNPAHTTSVFSIFSGLSNSSSNSTSKITLISDENYNT